MPHDDDVGHIYIKWHDSNKFSDNCTIFFFQSLVKLPKFAFYFMLFLGFEMYSRVYI